MISVLIVDDEPQIVEVLKEYAEYNDMLVDTASDGAEALEKAGMGNYNVIVMDIMMPRLNGFEAVKAIKQIKSTPIILISAKTEEYDKLKGFELGVDDYIVKPFSPKEVMARIKALMKRIYGFANVQTFGDLKIDFEGHKVYIKDELLKLTKKQYNLLLVFIKNRGVVLSRERLLSEIWGFDFDGEDRTVDAHIKMLRAHLGEFGKNIKTIRGAGYKFEYSENKN